MNNGLGFVDIIGGIVGGVGQIFALKQQAKMQSKQAKAEAKQMKAAQAMQVMQAEVDAAASARKRQFYTVLAVGGVAAVVATVIILRATRGSASKRK